MDLPSQYIEICDAAAFPYSLIAQCQAKTEDYTSKKKDFDTRLRMPVERRLSGTQEC